MIVYPTCLYATKQNLSENKNRSKRHIFYTSVFPTKLNSGEENYILSICYKYTYNKYSL